MKKFFTSGQFLPYLFFGLMGSIVVSVVGYIGINAIKNHGFLPPPHTLDRYECAWPQAPFSFYYLHGTERVEIRSKAGAMQGTINSQNWFDWRNFAQDRTLLGFAPPIEITFEAANSLRMSGPDFSEVTCVNTVDTSGRKRSSLGG